jgi:hypothetical protein
VSLTLALGFGSSSHKCSVLETFGSVEMLDLDYTCTVFLFPS